ncbi:MAG: FUSC family membrane protein, partial [Endozoicomonas sp.]
RLVAALNAAKATLLSRVRRHHSPRQQALLQTYFLAQDIHERVSSSHYCYQDLASAFGRSDILFRFQRVLMAQARDCRNIARTLAMGKQYHHGKESAWVLDELQHSLDHLKSLQEAQPNPQRRSLLIQLNYLFNNLATVELQMSIVGNPEPGQKMPVAKEKHFAPSSLGKSREAKRFSRNSEEEELADCEPRGIRAMLRRIRGECHRDSLLFRHAIRLSIALTAGYGIIQFLHMERGYWILLTTLFVCQPNYSATRQKLTQRIVGTLGGLFLGMPLLYLFPGQEGQLVLMVVAGVLFFAFRTVRYDVATACITLLVLFCFNQLGQGFAVILPRLGDTLLGCLLAVMAVSFILPDWESRRLNRIMASAIGRNREYLAQIISQYQKGKH